MKRALLTIGSLAKESRVNISTIRFYERRGLILHPSRTDGGYRLYTEDAVVRIRFIRCLQALGFTLNEIKRMLEEWSKHRVSRGVIRSWIQAKISHLEALAEENERRRAALRRVMARCDQAPGRRKILIFEVFGD